MPPTITTTVSRLKGSSIGLTAPLWPNIPRSTTQALPKVLARKNTQVRFTSV